VVTAPEAYKLLLRDHLSPRLRTLGFRGAGSEWELPSPSHWILLGFRRDRFTDAELVKLTVSLQVVRRDTWRRAHLAHSYVKARPRPNVITGAFAWHTGLGSLMPTSRDPWWSLRPSDDLEALAEDVVAAVRDYALPAMQRQVEATSAPE
jgi:Domain of unknown function (DUF4304)